jgi:hypothetical protein
VLLLSLQSLPVLLQLAQLSRLLLLLPLWMLVLLLFVPSRCCLRPQLHLLQAQPQPPPLGWAQPLAGALPHTQRCHPSNGL